MRTRKVNPQVDYEISKELGECYLLMGEFSKAEEYYRQASLADGQRADPYLGLAAVALKRGRFDDARTMYAKAAALEQSMNNFGTRVA